MLYQLSYEATHWERGQFIEFIQLQFKFLLPFVSVTCSPHETFKDLYGNPYKCDWVPKVVFLIQILLSFNCCCDCYFRNIRLKILRLPNFNMFFQLVLTKYFQSELFSCLPKVDQVIKSCKEPIACYFGRTNPVYKSA